MKLFNLKVFDIGIDFVYFSICLFLWFFEDLIFVFLGLIIFFKIIDEIMI